MHVYLYEYRDVDGRLHTYISVWSAAWDSIKVQEKNDKNKAVLKLNKSRIKF